MITFDPSPIVNWCLVLLGAGIGAGGFFCWGRIAERGLHDCDPCPRRHADELR